MNSVTVFCDECCEKVDASVLEFDEVREVRGDQFLIKERWPVCPHCDQKIGNAAFAEENFRKLYDAYREKHHIPSAEEIRSLRKRLGLTQSQFADLLGIGVASLQRYEKGSLPTDAHARILRHASNPMFLKEYIFDLDDDENDTFRMVSAKIEDYCKKAIESDNYLQIVWSVVPLMPNDYNGNISFNIDRFRELLIYFAQNIKELFRTKLNKVLFYADFSMHRYYGQGITGLRYAHADYGPVPDKYEIVIAPFIDEITLHYEDIFENAQILRALREPDMTFFSSDEMSQLQQVVDFINSFKTTTDLVAYTHEEDAWKRTSSGEIISYSWSRSLKGVAVPVGA